MTWDTLAANWIAAKDLATTRFPHLNEDALRVASPNMQTFAQQLAESHDLTFAEALEETQNWLDSLLFDGLRKAA